MSKITLTALELVHAPKSLFNNEPAIYITDCTSKLNREAYRADCEFLQSNPGRRIYVRAAYQGEFDSFDSVEEFLQLPMIFAQVTQLAPGIHECKVVYYGRKYANVPTRSDSDVAQLLLRMQRDMGGDRQEIEVFYRQVKTNSEAKLMQLGAEEAAEDAATSTHGKEATRVH